MFRKWDVAGLELEITRTRCKFLPSWRLRSGKVWARCWCPVAQTLVCGHCWTRAAHLALPITTGAFLGLVQQWRKVMVACLHFTEFNLWGYWSLGKYYNNYYYLQVIKCQHLRMVYLESWNWVFIWKKSVCNTICRHIMQFARGEHGQIDLQVKYFVELTSAPFCDLKYSEVLETFFFFFILLYLDFGEWMTVAVLVPDGIELIM